MPPRKRKASSMAAAVAKADDSTGRKKKLTKAEKLAAQEKARQWAQETYGKSKADESPPKPTKRRRVEKTVSTPQTKTTTRTTRSTPRSTTKQKPSHTRKTHTPKRSTFTGASVKTSSTNKSKPESRRASFEDSTSVSETKKQKLAEAQARAAQWGAAQKKGTLHPVQEDSDKDEMVEKEEVRPEESSSEEEMAQDFEAAVEQEELVPDMPLPRSSVSFSAEQKREGRARAAVWAREERQRQETPQPKLTPPPANLYEPSPSNSPIVRETVSSPPDAAAGFGRRHVATAAATHQEAMFQDILASPNLNEVWMQVKRQQREQEQTQERLDREVSQIVAHHEVQVAAAVTPAHDETMLEVDEYQPKRFRNMIKVVLKLILALVILLCGGVVYMMLPSDQLSMTISATHKAPFCFVSNGHGEVGPPQWLVEKGIETCKGIDKPLPCPAGGRCSDGFLRECPDSPYLEPSATGHACVLSQAPNETVDRLQGTLVNLTADYTCSLLEDSQVVPKDTTSGEAPLFDVKDILTDGHVDVSLLELATSTLQVQDMGNGTVLVGLTDDYVKNHLPLPGPCWLGMFVMDVVGLFWSLVVSPCVWTLVAAFGISKRVALKFPLESLAAFVVVMFVRYIRNRRRKGAELLNTVAVVRHLAYSKLQGQYFGHSKVLQLRDEIIHELHPSSKKNRDYLLQTIWPRVVWDVKRDNRVEKSKGMSDRGTPCDVWRWVAPRFTASAKSKHE